MSSWNWGHHAGTPWSDGSPSAVPAPTAPKSNALFSHPPSHGGHYDIYASSDQGVNNIVSGIDKEIEDIRKILVQRQRKMKTLSEDKHKPLEALDFDIDAELARLQGSYSIDLTAHVPVDDLISDTSRMLASTGLSFSSCKQENPGQTKPKQQQSHDQSTMALRTVQGSKSAQNMLDRFSKSNPRDPHYAILKEYTMGVFQGVKGQLNRLLTHRSANYAVSKLYQVLDKTSRLEFLNEIKPNVGRICCHQHGTFAVQKLISCFSSEAEAQILIDGFIPDIRALVFDQHAAFSLRKLFSSKYSHLTTELMNNFIYGPGENSTPAAISDYLCTVAVEKHGAMFLTVVLCECNREHLQLLVELLLPNIVETACDQFGNYVAQVALEQCLSTEYSNRIIDKLTTPDPVLLKVATNTFGVKVLLSSLSLQPW
eukprot:CAMPEP_0203758852 /NCGR_PEP_ID=MMETSP0098-20131031/11732_1 /ASSEMBLY_ACC=CAM_ASM_000208 /TAXON_ID=96639 /ORGANISM=" , Strain NY0313808BC1" /LENGTH=426 /DNA_ID=CAMNT_0050651493 /DNA_START=13 /DNA_END=1290 /DNA_ORIENTATION=+